MIFPYYGNELDLVKHNVLKRSADGWPEWAAMPANVLGQMKDSVSAMVSPRKRRELEQVKGYIPQNTSSFCFFKGLTVHFEFLTVNFHL